MQTKYSKATPSSPSFVLSYGSLEWTVGHIVTYITTTHYRESGCGSWKRTISFTIYTPPPSTLMFFFDTCWQQKITQSEQQLMA